MCTAEQIEKQKQKELYVADKEKREYLRAEIKTRVSKDILEREVSDYRYQHLLDRILIQTNTPNRNALSETVEFTLFEYTRCYVEQLPYDELVDEFLAGYLDGAIEYE
jgi:hypothetical protein